jgi:hypothetical protein
VVVYFLASESQNDFSHGLCQNLHAGGPAKFCWPGRIATRCFSFRRHSPVDSGSRRRVAGAPRLIRTICDVFPSRGDLRFILNQPQPRDLRVFSMVHQPSAPVTRRRTPRKNNALGVIYGSLNRKRGIVSSNCESCYLALRLFTLVPKLRLGNPLSRSSGLASHPDHSQHCKFP